MKEEVYEKAWGKLFAFLASSETHPAAPTALSSKDLSKMKVAELRALCEKKKLIKPAAKRVLKADMIQLLELTV